MNSNKLRGVIAAVTSALLMGFGANAMADTTDDIVNALILKGVLTEEEGSLLLNARGLENEKKAKTPEAKFKDGVVFESPNGDFSFQPTGRIHADYRIFDHDDSENNKALTGVGNSLSTANPTNIGADTFDIRRARIGFKTKYKKYYEAELNADISTGANTSVTSTNWDVAYFNVAWWQQAQFRFGLFKMPMNLEELTSSNNIDFMERSYVNALSPTKELGAMIHGVPMPGVTYALAFSNGNAKNVETDIREDGKDVIGRVTANFAELMAVPNKEAVYHLGASFSKGDSPSTGAVGVNGRTESRGVTFFRAPTIANGAGSDFESNDRTRVGLEAVAALKNFKVQGEWLKLNNDFTTHPTAATSKSFDLDTNAWYVEALWAITGEKYADSYKNGAFGGIKPLNDFNPETFKGGAWEIGLRYNQFDASDYNTAGVAVGDTTSSGFGTTATAATKAGGFAKAKSYTAGLKFLPNSNMRFMLNYVKTDFSDVIGGASGGVVLNNKRVDDEQAIIMRTQWMF